MFRYLPALLIFFAANSFAEDIWQCFTQAANAYHVPRHVLVAIAKVESDFISTAYHVNSNKSADIGIMQINTAHIPFLEKHGIPRESLWNPCVNIKVGAWVLATQMRKHGKTWRAVGAYNAKSEAYRKQYVHKVWVAMRSPS